MRLHQRQIIRSAVVDTLIRANTSAGERVFPMRFTSYAGLKDLPAIGVYATKESVDPASKSTAPRRLSRTAQFTIEAVIRYEDATIEDDLDVACVEIERAMDADPAFGDVAGDSILTETGLRVFVEGDRLYGVAELTYAVEYETSAPEAEDVRLDDLKTIDSRTSLAGGQAAADQAEDRLENLDGA